MKHHWVALALAVALSGCGKVSGANDAICTTPAIYPVGVNLPPVERSKWCVHRWAYKLAQSNEPVGVVADAAVGACLDALLASQVELGAFQAGKGVQPGGPDGQIVASRGAEQGFSLFSGRSIGVAAQTYELLRSEAVFRVVQARAGKCSPDV